MAFIKPPILTGRDHEDLAAMRDWAFQMISVLEDVLASGTNTTKAVSVSTRGDGQQVVRTGEAAAADIEAVRKNAQELKSLIVKSAKNLQKQIDNIEAGYFYIKYADYFTGSYPATMYNTPTADTYFMGVCSTTAETAPTSPEAYTWSRIKGDGGTGLNSATIFLYQRAASAPARPVSAMTYTFASGELDLVTAGETHWTQEIPNADGNPCWITTATAINTTPTDEIAANEWSTVKKLVEDGQRGQDGTDGTNGTNGVDGKDGKDGKDGRDGKDGADGTNGTNGQDGSDGVDGYNSCVVFLYRRSASAASVDFTDALTYSFTDKRLTNVPTGWYRTPPQGTSPLYVTAATAQSRTAEATIAYTDWADPVILAQDGEQGIQGIPGNNGQTTYLHIKYSNDGQTFTVNPITGEADGETVGAFIGTLTNYTQADSTTFSDYTWHRFADDTELRAIITAGDNAVIDLIDRKEEEYNGKYVAVSDFGVFERNIDARIETTAAGVVESYGYAERISSVQDSIDLMQHYYTNIDGEIRRGVVEDPETGNYVTGIAISQNLRFSGECGPTDQNNPGDGYTYYYLESGQTFGLYTSTGWQFWIDGYKKGWFDSVDGMLHVANIIVENVLQIGDSWQLKAATDGSEFELLYVGG